MKISFINVLYSCHIAGVNPYAPNTITKNEVNKNIKEKKKGKRKKSYFFFAEP